LPEEAEISVQKQMGAVKKLVDKSPLVVYLTAVISTISVGLAAQFCPTF
jgi:hypothetical protein